MQYLASARIGKNCSPTARAGILSSLNALFKAFPQIQHLVTASLETAIFAVSSLGVDDLAAVFTLDSAHTGAR